MRGTIFNIQDFCVDDGPGIRTTVFLKGCPLRCAWCHNPESHVNTPELLYDEKNCISCGRCVSCCPNKAHSLVNGKHSFNREKCNLCGKCSTVCFSNALTMCGEEKGVDEIIEHLKANLSFYKNTGGGLTVSGGEPLSQPEFTLALCKAAKKEGVHVCMETSGYGKGEDLLKMLPFVDIFLYDYKIGDRELHKTYTVRSNQIILDNLSLLNANNAHVVLRCPIIPNVNLSQEHFTSIEKLIKEYACVSEIHLLPYHPLGIEKSKKLGKAINYSCEDFLNENVLLEYQQMIKNKTQIPVKIIN